jgi:hypothetical protein
MSICVQSLLSDSVYLAPRVQKTRKYPHGEPTIEFTTPQTTVVYNHNTLNTNAPFKFFIFIFFFILHHGKIIDITASLARRPHESEKIILSIAHFAKRKILHSIFVVGTVVFGAQSRLFHRCFKRID